MSLLKNIRILNAAAVGGALEVTGAADFKSTVTVTGAAELKSTLDVTGAALLSSTLGVTGDADFDGAFDLQGSATLQDTLTVAGDTDLNGLLDVQGTATLQSTLGVTGATVLSSTLEVTGDADLNGALDVQGDVNLQAKLDVGGDVTIAGNLSVEGKTTSIQTENVNIKDSHLYVNKNYLSSTARTGGIAVNTKAIAQSLVQSVSGTSMICSVATGEGSLFETGDMVELSGLTATSDDGLYVVQSVSGDDVTLDSSDVFSGGAFSSIVQTAGSNGTVFFEQISAAGTLAHVHLSFLVIDENQQLVTAVGSTYDELTATESASTIPRHDIDYCSAFPSQTGFEVDNTSNPTMGYSLPSNMPWHGVTTAKLPRVIIVDTSTAAIDFPLPYSEIESGTRLTVVRKGSYDLTINTDDLSVSDGFDGDSSLVTFDVTSDAEKVELMYSSELGLSTWYFV